ncbi:MAG: hybrid sensor histidine kinase/response regulator [Proteobacteria bacterium]|nr:hybrid sensor histidine kinase/response regulator [Pseudomonadota bacterium]MCP4916714.1 hybrid sensor histidine kinase/response regulator [Pseudomonadota bacterium]
MTQLSQVEDASRLMDTGIVDVVLVHTRAAGIDGLLETAGDVPVVICSDRPSVAEAVAAMKAGAADYVPPTSAEQACLDAVLGHTTGDAHEVRMRLAATQAALVERERLAIVGQLAAGVAHEINNPSAFVVANLEELRAGIRDLRELLKVTMEAAVLSGQEQQLLRIQRLSDQAGYPELIPEMLTMMHESLTGMARIRNIVQDLKGFSRLDDGDRVPADVRRLLERSIGLTQNELRYRGRIETTIERVPAVLCAPGRISQVFVHVVSFLVHLSEESSPDRVFRVSCQPEGPWVKLTFNDTGTELDEPTLARIWDPVLENERPTGARTGLGLAVCREILRRHQGEIDILPRDGTTIVVRLPAINPMPATSFALLPDEDGEGDILEYASVMVVDDEPSLVNSLRRVLRGVKAFASASSGRLALEQLEEGIRPDIILCDLMMSDVSGPELYERVTADYPELADRMLFITGGAFTEDTRAFSEAHEDRVLFKPIPPQQLRERMRAHLAETKTVTGGS